MNGARRRVHDAIADLRAGRPGLLVVAHPDDETLAVGGHLPRMRGLHVLHLTDGAPRDPSFAQRAGFASSEAYAEARRAELGRALDLAGVHPERRHRLALTDQALAHALPGAMCAVDALLEALRPEVVLTHAYEGGHPDHDATAVAVHMAVRATAERRGRAPSLVEMPYYHSASGALRTGEFVDAACTGQPSAPLSYEVLLDDAALELKRAMLACFASQRDVIAPFDPTRERFRLAPAYRLDERPHHGPLHYERLGWPISGDEVCRRAAEAREALEGSARACG